MPEATRVPVGPPGSAMATDGKLTRYNARTTEGTTSRAEPVTSGVSAARRPQVKKQMVACGAASRLRFRGVVRGVDRVAIAASDMAIPLSTALPDHPPDGCPKRRRRAYPPIRLLRPQETTPRSPSAAPPLPLRGWLRSSLPAPSRSTTLVRAGARQSGPRSPGVGLAIYSSRRPAVPS